MPGVVTATFTGKAALVLRRKGTPARTIHSLIYSVIEATEEEIEAAAKEDRGGRGRRASPERASTAPPPRRRSRPCARRSSPMKKPRFALNPQSDAAHARLIVLDEVSMVGEEMARDLMSFGKPILVLGDPGQLPPIKGEGAFTKDAPDIMLTEIHRQAAESAIIRLATMARQGEPIGFGQLRHLRLEDAQDGRHAGAVPARRPGHLRHERHPPAAQQRACAAPPASARRLLPTGQGEKIICLKNQNDLGLINGMFLTLEDIVDEGSLYFSAAVTDEDGNPIGTPAGRRRPGRLRIYKGHFEDHVAFDKNRHDRDWKDKRNLTEATFGWAITGHKSQGSQWENVIVWDDGLGRSEQDRRRWLYTVDHPRREGLVISDMSVHPHRRDRSQRRLAAAGALSISRRCGERLAATAADWLPATVPAGAAVAATGRPCAAPICRAGRRARRAPASSISRAAMPAGASTTPPARAPGRST